MLHQDDSFQLTIGPDETELTHPNLPGSRLALPTTQLAGKFFGSQNTSTGILPPVVRWISPDFHRVILERPPFMAKIKFKNAEKEDKGEIHQMELPIPWTVWYLKLGKDYEHALRQGYIWARNTPIYTEDDELFALPISNVWSSGEMCVGKIVNNELAAERGATQKIDIGLVINRVMSTFWSTTFNLDLLDNLYRNRLPEELVKACDGYDASSDNTALNILQHWSTMSEFESLDMAYQSIPRITFIEGTNTTDALRIRDVIEHAGKLPAQSHAKSPRPFLSFFRSLALDALNNEA